jgi:predicted Zn finger-like uncharacterized protein
MVIECKNCLKIFNLDEHRLRPNGSKVRCTKCGDIFFAFPPSIGSCENRLPTENEINTKKVDNDKTNTPSTEQKMHHKIQVSVPASCISNDAEGNSLDFNIGRITDVSQQGIALEIFCNSSFEFILISFISLDDREIQIKGRVVDTKRNALGKMRIELALIGTSKEIADFVSHAIRYHHYATKPVDRVQKTEKAQYPTSAC